MTHCHRQIIAFKHGFVLAACLAIAACGGGGGGASTGATASPEASLPSPPTATPTPAPVPKALSFTTVEVGVDTDASGVLQMSIPAESSSPVIVSDPNSPTATRFEDFRLDGNETIRASGFGSHSGISISASPATYQASSVLRFTQLGTLPRQMPVLMWASPSDSEPLAMPLAETVEKLPGTSSTTGMLPKHARLLEVGSPNFRGIRVFGSNTLTSSVPEKGSSRYVGELFGTVYPTGEAPSRLVGDCVLNVYFDGEQPYVTGLIKFSQYERTDNRGTVLTIDFVADIVRGKLVTRSIQVTGTGNMVQYGAVAGGFYGDDASELGFTISARGPSGILIGGAILGIGH
ncbi:hypothetical protein [Sphingomonas sp. BK345]|uniref:hypothetical protein n=1 Tax=Sphingomonas sp. BK345 TaxID=2586980 RepID=UPI001619ED0C|nr:hypothetical protein [Sphingomonas sp. BK345]MBB3472916.1 hypothetical protein [Sphingomonas sp. BK345]